MKELHCIDCLDLMEQWFKEGKEPFIYLIYIDPPYNSGRNYKDKNKEVMFSDIWNKVPYEDELNKLKHMNPSLHKYLKVIEETF